MRERIPRLVALVAVGAVASCAVGFWLATPLLAVAAAVVAVVLGGRLAIQAGRHAGVARALRADSLRGAHRDIDLRWRPLGAGAAVAGLRHPEIFCDPALARTLSDDELAAVILHERCHQLHRDPVRLLALSVVEPVVRVVPAGRAWLEARRARIEVRADRFALERGAGRPTLARAILALGGTSAAATATAGFTSAQELRLRALLDDPGTTVVDGGYLTRSWLPAIAVGVAVILCGAAFAHHLVVGDPTIGCALAGC